MRRARGGTTPAQHREIRRNWGEIKPKPRIHIHAEVVGAAVGELGEVGLLEQPGAPLEQLGPVRQPALPLSELDVWYVRERNILLLFENALNPLL